MNGWRKRGVMNEVRSRGRNESIEKLNDSMGEARPNDLYVCECSDGGCTSTVRLTRLEYEAVRADGRTFALRRNHEDPQFDLLMDEYVRYSIVAKLPGEPAEIALGANPRASS